MPTSRSIGEADNGGWTNRETSPFLAIQEKNCRPIDLGASLGKHRRRIFVGASWSGRTARVWSVMCSMETTRRGLWRGPCTSALRVPPLDALRGSRQQRDTFGSCRSSSSGNLHETGEGGRRMGSVRRFVTHFHRLCLPQPFSSCIPQMLAEVPESVRPVPPPAFPSAPPATARVATPTAAD